MITNMNRGVQGAQSRTDFTQLQTLGYGLLNSDANGFCKQLRSRHDGACA